MKKKVVIVGGGFGGITAIRNLINRKDIEITLLDHHPYHYLQTEVYDFIANKTDLSDITLSLVTFASSYTPNLIFLHRKMVGVEFDSNVVLTDKNERISYDYLIIATGSRTQFPEFITGLAEFSHGVKSVRRAFEFRQQFEQLLCKMIENEGECSLEPESHIVIGGAGLSGVEIAAETALYSREFFENANYTCSGLKVHLIEGAASILPGQHPFMIEKSEQRLKELGVNIVTGKFISKIERNRVYLNDGSEIPMSFMIWTGGVTAVKSTACLGVELNKRGQVISDKYCRINGKENVFVIGDAGEFKNSTGEPLVQTAWSAEETAKVAVKNIKNMIDGKELFSKDISQVGIVVELGGHTGAGVLFGSIKVSGFLAYLIKQSIFRYWKWPIMARCRAGSKTAKAH